MEKIVLSEIAKFDRSGLKKRETKRKKTLPTKEVIDRERKRQKSEKG